MATECVESQAQRDRYWMGRALQLAQRAEQLGEVPVGALLVLDDKLIGEGWNQPISGCDPTAHAEIVALRQAAQNLNNYRVPGATLYVTIEPCTMCAGALIHSRVARVVFAAAEPKAGAVISSQQNLFQQDNLNHRIDYEHGVCEAEAVAMIQAFFQRRRQERRAQKLAARSTQAP
ncbi:MAG: tRNA adenosine(34) deaminase TadA [Gammaproteobacteria bacterium]|nr:tRNA adenosine(34) deaminase TadA [Gammaproteobacteria bacterium]